jgi:hypothetical protein
LIQYHVAGTRRADHRHRRQPGDRRRRQQRGRAGLAEILAEHPGEAAAEEREGEAGDDLLSLEADRDDGMQDGEQPAGQHPEDEPEPGVAGPDRRAKGDDRAHQHHPLDPEVDDARPLREDLADRGEQVDSSGGDPGGEDDRGIHQPARRSIRKR